MSTIGTGRLVAALLALGLAVGGCTADGMSIAEEEAAARQAEASARASAGEHLVTDDVRPQLTPVARLEAAPDDEVHATYGPAVPPPVDRDDQRTFEVRMESLEGVCPVDPDNGVTTEMWGFRLEGDEQFTCGAPGPVLRGRVGDVVTITLTNLPENQRPHNIDFHAFTGQGGGAEALVVEPGETASVQVRLLYPGAFMYHCAYGDVPAHIAHGMYGMFIVDPAEPLPGVDHEWAVVQSEWYVEEPGADGEAPFDREAVTLEEPRYVTFNGRTDALVGDDTLAMRVGERARIYFVNAGLNLDSNFHPIGSHWDAVYPEAATHEANGVIRGSQSTLVVAGGGTVVELDALVPSTVILVDHALARTFDKGAIGTIVIEGEADPEIYAAPGGEPREQVSEESTGADDAGVATASVSIPDGAFLPENADSAYDPLDVEVAVGTTITWTNDDTVAHTVTSGVADDSGAEADGTFDSRFVEPGETWSHTFTEPGEFPYFCAPHPWMRGSVTVTE